MKSLCKHSLEASAGNNMICDIEVLGTIVKYVAMYSYQELIYVGFLVTFLYQIKSDIFAVSFIYRIICLF